MNKTSSGKSDWCTPQSVIEHVKHVFGRVPALDPCWNPESPVPAMRRWTPNMVFGPVAPYEKTPEDTFGWPWVDYTYVNPPYGNDPTGRAFKQKIIEAACARVCMMVCVPANTGTAFMQFLMMHGLTKFCSPRVQFIDPATGQPCKGVMHDTALVLLHGTPAMEQRHRSNTYVRGVVK